MFYRLSDSYRLDGWRKLPTGIVCKKTGDVFFLSQEEYRILLHMNGHEEINIDALTPRQQRMVARFLKQKIIEESVCPFLDSEKVFYCFHDHTYIKSVQWSVTGKCNYHCRHCLLSAPENNTEELSTQQCLDIIRQIAECGIHQISFTGGEPLVRQDFMELVQACTEAGIQITELYTNGALLTSELLHQIVSYGQFPQIQISYDGIGWHDWVRGHAGAQKAAEQALLAAHKAGLKTGAAMSIFKDNVSSIRETVRFLASLQVDYIKISPMLPLGLWKNQYADKTLTAEEFLNVILEYIPNFFADGKPCHLEMGGYFEYIKEKDFSTAFLAKDPKAHLPLYPCPSAAANLYISSDGQVFPCMEFACLPQYASFPRLQDVPLEQILQDSVLLKTMHTKLNDIYAQNEECKNCPERGVHCGQSCRACAEPDFFGIDRDTCCFVKNGWFRLVQKSVEKAGGTFILQGGLKKYVLHIK